LRTLICHYGELRDYGRDILLILCPAHTVRQDSRAPTAEAPAQTASLRNRSVACISRGYQKASIPCFKNWRSQLSAEKLLLPGHASALLRWVDPLLANPRLTNASGWVLKQRGLRERAALPVEPLGW